MWSLFFSLLLHKIGTKESEETNMMVHCSIYSFHLWLSTKFLKLITELIIENASFSIFTKKGLFGDGFVSFCHCNMSDRLIFYRSGTSVLH